MNLFRYLVLASVLASTITLCMTANSVSSRSKNQQRSTNYLRQQQQQRTRRQSLKRQPGFFFLLHQFIFDTVNDTSIAYRNISKIFNDQFTTTTPSPTSQTDGNSTSTPAPPLTMQQLFDVLGRNYRGLVRLFNREWNTALRDSHRNVAQFRRDFKESLRPFFEPNPNITNAIT